MSWVLLTERGLLWGSALCPRLKGEGKEFLGPSLCLAHALQISLVSGCAIPEWEKLLSNTSLVVSSLPDAAFWEDFWRDFSGRFQMGKEAANFREMGPRLTCCDAPECERWGSAEGWLLFALLYLWVLLVCPPSRLGYASLHFHLLPFQNPSSSLGFLSSEEEFLKAQNFTSSPPLSPPLILFPLLNVSFLVCFFFLSTKDKGGKTRYGSGTQRCWRWLACLPCWAQPWLVPRNSLPYIWSVFLSAVSCVLSMHLATGPKTSWARRVYKENPVTFQASRPRMNSHHLKKWDVHFYLKIFKNEYLKK